MAYGWPNQLCKPQCTKTSRSEKLWIKRCYKKKMRILGKTLLEDAPKKPVSGGYSD